MYTIKEEVYIICYLIFFGIYLFSTLDIITIIYEKFKNKPLKIIIQIIFWLCQIYITFIFSYHLMDGYVPIYFILFILMGYLIYHKLCQKHFIKLIKLLLKEIKKIFSLIIKIIKPLIYSKPLLNFIKNFFKREKNIIKKQLFTKNKKKIN